MRREDFERRGFTKPVPLNEQREFIDAAVDEVVGMRLHNGKFGPALTIDVQGVPYQACCQFTDKQDLDDLIEGLIAARNMYWPGK